MTNLSKSNRILAALWFAAMVVDGMPARADAVRSPGKAAAYISVSNATFPTSTAMIAAVQLLKGKKKRVLEVEGTAIETSNLISSGLGVWARVNGMPLEPSSSFQVEEGCTTSTVSCTAQGQWWLDLDQAEAASPGLFIGQPLNVELYVSSGTSGAVVGTASLRARLMKY